MPHIDVKEPHIVGEIRLLRTDEGGRSSALLAPHFTCPMEIAGEFLTCRLDLAAVGRLDPGCMASVSIRFLAPELVRDELKTGLRFTLWEGKTIAVGTVLRVFGVD